ncbi:hypothetical protein ABKA04_003881 [Annulohypoxylon sp. FPYF3050]
MAPQKPRCTFKECKSAAQRIVGDCGFCDGHFCAKHRLLEDHKCSGLEDVSMNPTSPSSCDADGSATEWWLVGLAEYLTESGLDKESCARVGTNAGHPGCIRDDPEHFDRHSRRSIAVAPDPDACLRDSIARLLNPIPPPHPPRT